MIKTTSHNETEVLQGNQRSGSDILISMDKANFKRSERYFKEFESNPSIRSKSLQSLNGSEIGYTKQQIKGKSSVLKCSSHDLT